MTPNSGMHIIILLAGKFPCKDTEIIDIRLINQIHQNSFNLSKILNAFFIKKFLVPKEGLEPSRLSTPDPKSGAAANFATWACEKPNRVFLCQRLRAELFLLAISS